MFTDASWKFLWVILGIIFSAEANLDYFSHVRGVTQTGVLESLHTPVIEAKTYVFRGMTIGCNGKIGQWEFYAENTGTFFASVWRINHANQTMKLVGKNKLTAKKNREYNRVEIPVLQRIPVQPGDVLGVHYEDSSAVPVLSMEKDYSNKGMALGPVTTFGNYDADLTQGKELPVTDEFHAVASIKATVQGSRKDLKLVEGSTSYRGRAEMLKSDKWGTICDRWFEGRGWPLLFCYELGYPDVEFANTTTILQTAQAPEDATIHLMSPRCKPSNNQTMFDCDVHPKGDCGHDLDIFVACKPRLQLKIAEDNPGWFIPEVFDCGIWGDICDNRSPSHHLDKKSSSWLTAFCVELGFAGLKDVERFDSSETDRKILMENPDCGNINNPKLLSQCPSGPLETKCDGLLYYVQCEE